MTLMRLREVTPCRVHRRTIVVLEDAQRQLTLTFYADPHEASRLVRVLERGPQACHPVYDFVRGLLSAFEAGVTRVVLDDVPGEGIGSVLHVQWAGDALVHAEQLPRDTGPGADATLRAWVDRVRPDDFSRGDAGNRP